MQFGYPTLFITILPYEWDFPKSVWLKDYLHISDSVPTKCGAAETLHISHILDQLSRGYITGVNCNAWERHDIKHVMYASRHKKPNNVSCVFYRFEYQQRRTIHLHMLVWLNSCTELDLNRFNATVPQHNIHDAFLVTRLQASNTTVPFLQECDETTALGDQIILKRSPSDQSINLRAYIDTILFLLKSRMDVQCTDGRAALMKYVTSYVSKLTENAKLLRSTDSTAFHQLWPFLIDMAPGEPEMAMCFSSTPLSYCNKSRVKLVPPAIAYFDKHVISAKYIDRPADAESLTCLQYCRQYCVSKAVPTEPTTRNIVGVHYKYIFNPRFFWEYIIVNTPFRCVNKLKDPHHDELPIHLQSFSYIIHNHGPFILSNQFTTILAAIGYNDIKILEFIILLRGYSLIYYQCLRSPHCLIYEINTGIQENLNMEQLAVFNHITSKIESRSSILFNKECEDDDSSLLFVAK